MRNCEWHHYAVSYENAFIVSALLNALQTEEEGWKKKKWNRDKEK